MANLNERVCIYDRWQRIMMIRVASSEIQSYSKVQVGKDQEKAQSEKDSCVVLFRK